MRTGAAALALTLLLAACSNTTAAPASARPRPSGSAATPSTLTPAPSPTPLPPLPGPAIVQVENSPAGRPQSGLAAAQVVYEYVAEGGVGRFSLVFFGAPPPAQLVGPVRSARTATIGLATLYGAFVTYSGASTYIQGLLGHAGFPSFDEDSARGNLFRIGSRAAPHNLYTDGNHLAALAGLAKRPPVGYRLWAREAVSSHTIGLGTAVSAFTVPVSAFERPVFAWAPDLGGFTRTEATGPVTDPVSGAPLAIPTVIVQQVAVTVDPNVVDVLGTHGVDHRLTGSGAAQVFTGGRAYPATWTQPASGPPGLVLADGTPAPIASGEVWICLVPTGQPAALTPA